MGQNPRFITPLCEKWTSVLEHPRLSDRAKVLLMWLAFTADPRSGRLQPIGYPELCDALLWGRKKVRMALVELIDAGLVAGRISPGPGGGWLEVVGYFEVMRMTKWLARQRAMGRTPG